MSEVPAVEERGIVECLFEPRKAKLLQRVTTRPPGRVPREAGDRVYRARSGYLSIEDPTTGTAGCCAHAESGHATAAPPSAASNSRRPMVTVIRQRYHATSEAGMDSNVTCTCPRSCV